MPSKSITSYAPDVGERHVFKLGDWPIRVEHLFLDYLQNYKEIPDYKKLLRSLTGVDELYSPLRRSSLKPDWSGEVESVNNYKKAKRAEIYMKEKDLLETSDPSKGKRLVLTSKGHKLFYKDFPLSKLRKNKWDGIWTVVLYDFPEKMDTKRKVFRQRLVKLGFGKAQLSVYVTPLPIATAIGELIRTDKLNDYVWVLTGRAILGMSDKDVARTSWPLEDLNTLYSKLLEVYPKVIGHKNRDLVLSGWLKMYLSVNSKDPHLPDELLPLDWKGETCRKKFQRSSITNYVASIF